MIGVRLEGRLGNQLFQYAFVYAAARKLNARFYVDRYIEPFLLPRYFDLPRDRFSSLNDGLFAVSGFKNLFSHHLRRSFYRSVQQVFGLSDVAISDHELPETELQKLRNGALYTGYFQSERYFADYRDDIRRLFTLRRPFRQRFAQVLPATLPGQRLVVIHVRRGDYVQNEEHLALPLSYYRKAVATIQSPENVYVIISDDPDFAEAEFADLHPRYISRNEAVIDFQFLVNADICILSNSTFSWWGAYLNTRNARVLAPRYWSGAHNGHEHPRGILPAGWTTLTADE